MSDEQSIKPPSLWAILLGTRLRKIFWICVLAAFVCVQCVKIFGRMGAKDLQLTYTKIAHDGFNPGSTLRVAFFADVHENRELLKECIEHIKKAEPDLIIFGGDLVMVGQRMKRTHELIETLRELPKIAPTFAILGNQDMERLPEVQRVLEESKIQILRNERLDWTSHNGYSLTLIGLGDWNEGDMKAELCMKKPGAEDRPVLLLSHDPESREFLDDYDWDIMLCGHTHGGQLGVPFSDSYISFRSEMPAGLYPAKNGKKIFVTRGVGSTYGMRFFCPPELSIIDIEAK